MFSLFSFDRWFARNKQAQASAPAPAQIHITVEEPIQIKEEELNKAVNSFLNDVKENTVTVNEELTNTEIDKLVQDVIDEQQATTNAVEVEVKKHVEVEVQVEVQVKEEVKEQVITNEVEEVKLTIDIPKEEVVASEVLNVTKAKKGRKKNKNT